MTGKLTVGQAYLLQAKEDLSAARILGKEIDSAPSSFFMLLQMVFEKLSKADKYWNNKHLPAILTHEGADVCFSKFIDVKTRMYPEKRKYFNHLSGLIKTLEAAQPSIAKKISSNSPILEYPWEDKNSIIRYPARDFPLVQQIKSSQMNRIKSWAALKFAQEYVNELEIKLQ